MILHRAETITHFALSPIYNSLSATQCAIRHCTLWGNPRFLAVARPRKPTQVLIAKVEFGLTFAIYRGDEGEHIHSNHVLSMWLMLICWCLPCTSGCGWKITKKVACSAGLLSLSAKNSWQRMYYLFLFYCEFVTFSFLESMDVHAITVSSSWLDDAARLHWNTAVRSRHLGILQACSKVKSNSKHRNMHVLQSKIELGKWMSNNFNWFSQAPCSQDHVNDTMETGEDTMETGEAWQINFIAEASIAKTYKSVIAVAMSGVASLSQWAASHRWSRVASQKKVINRPLVA